jgi:response regulator RpfG family c-di-GMP phosphodiesterase
MIMNHILIVDDEEPIRRLLSKLLGSDGYHCTLAADAAQARMHIMQETFELILCDLNMPGESGMDFTRYVLANYPDTAVVILTAMDEPELFETALEIGAYGYIIKPFKLNEVKINVANALRRRKLETENRSYRQNLEEMVLEGTEDLHYAMKSLVRARDNLQKTLKGITDAMASIVEKRDPYTAGHQQKVTQLALDIAKNMNRKDEEKKKLIAGIEVAGMIHDLGKIAVPAGILSKPGKLSDNERNLIKTHSQEGYDILKDIDFRLPVTHDTDSRQKKPHISEDPGQPDDEIILPVAQIVLQHHERMDGSGYPAGLSHNDILEEARIIAVADVVEAMANHRPYRSALSDEKVLEEIINNKGILYDSEVVEACFKVYGEKGFPSEN